MLYPQQIYDLYFGGNRITGQSQYLWRHPEEDGQAYGRRLARSAYVNFQKKIINTVKGYVFYSEPQVDSVLPLKKNAEDLTTHSLVGGIAYLLTLPEGIEVYPRTCVEAKEVKKADGSTVCDYEISGREGKITVMYSIGKVRHDIRGKNPVFTQLFEDQFLAVPWDISCESFIQDTAQLNLEIHNKRSWKSNTQMQVLVTIPYGPPIDTAEPGDGVYVNVGSEDQAPGFAQPSIAQTQFLGEDIDKDILTMGKMVGLESEFSDITKVQAGISTAYEMIDTIAMIGQIASAINVAINKASKCYTTMTGLNGGTIALAPLTNPIVRQGKISEFRALLKDVPTDKVTKYAQTKIVSIVAQDESPAVRKELIADVEENGGLKTQASPDLQF